MSTGFQFRPKQAMLTMVKLVHYCPFLGFKNKYSTKKYFQISVLRKVYASQFTEGSLANHTRPLSTADKNFRKHFLHFFHFTGKYFRSH